MDDKQQMDQELMVQQRQWEEKMELEHDQPIFEESDVVQDYQVDADHVPPGEQHFWGSVGCFPWKIKLAWDTEIRCEIGHIHGSDKSDKSKKQNYIYWQDHLMKKNQGTVNFELSLSLTTGLQADRFHSTTNSYTLKEDWGLRL